MTRSDHPHTPPPRRSPAAPRSADARPPCRDRLPARTGGAAIRAATLLLLAILTAACARQVSVESEPPGGQETVEVRLDEWSIDMPMAVPAGDVAFRVRNAGSVAHNFEVEGDGVERAFPSDLAPGETRTMTVTLTPGTYEIYCPVADHAERGMSRTLTVTRG